MKIPHDYGVYLWWPEEGEAAFHPDDVPLARKLIPGRCVFRREGLQGEYILLTYGQRRLRIKPAMFQPVGSEGFDIGDRVQVLSRCGQNRPFVGRVADMLWDVRAKQIRYRIRRVDRLVPRWYSNADLEQVELVEHLPKGVQADFAT